MVHGNVHQQERRHGQPRTCTGHANRNQLHADESCGTLVIDIAGPNTGQFSILNDLGTANLDGILDPVLLKRFYPHGR